MAGVLPVEGIRVYGAVSTDLLDLRLPALKEALVSHEPRVILQRPARLGL
jgi:hypothetical protein